MGHLPQLLGAQADAEADPHVRAQLGFDASIDLNALVAFLDAPTAMQAVRAYRSALASVAGK